MAAPLDTGGSTQTPINKCTRVPVGHILCSDKWRGTEITKQLQSKGIELMLMIHCCQMLRLKFSDSYYRSPSDRFSSVPHRDQVIHSRCPVDAPQMPVDGFSWRGTGQTSTGHPEGMWGWHADASARNSDCIPWKNCPNIYRASWGGLQVPLQEVFPVKIGRCPQNKALCSKFLASHRCPLTGA